MKICNNCGKEIHDSATKCRYCYAVQKGNPSGELMITSTDGFSGYEIIEHIDFVCEDTIFVSDLFTGIEAYIKDIQGTFEYATGKGAELKGTRDLINFGRGYVMANFQDRVKELGANAVIGFSVDAVVGSKILKISMNGTAVYAVREGIEEFEEEAKAEMKKRSEEEAAKAKAMADRVNAIVERVSKDGEPLLPIETILINTIGKRKDGIRSMELARIIPRNVTVTEVTEAVTHLLDLGLIEKDEFDTLSLGKELTDI